MGRLADEVDDDELRGGMAVAGRLHANFYHDFLRAEGFRFHRQAVLRFVERLRALLGGGARRPPTAAP